MKVGAIEEVIPKMLHKHAMFAQNPTHKLALLARTAKIRYESPFNQHNIYEKNP